MKRNLAASLAVLILCMSLGACAETYTVEGLYSVAYDETQYTLDNTSYAYDNTDDYIWLFMLYNDDLDIDASMVRLENYDGFSLYSATEDERAEYLSDTLDSLSDYDYKHLAVIETGTEGAIIPFYLYSGKDETGEYLIAETIASGYSLEFYCYYADSSTIDDALKTALTDVVKTFAPVR